MAEKETKVNGDSIKVKIMKNFIGCLTIKGEVKISPRAILDEERKK